MSHLLGKVIVRAQIEVKTGMRIGGTTTGLKVGGLDLNVITDPEGMPYIPGSSLKGKLRSLIERKEGVQWNKKDRDGKPTGHMCKTDEEYKSCSVCRIWGILAGTGFANPTLTRLIVRDAKLDPSSISEDMRKNLDLEWTEVKYETAINRISGTALHGSLRQAERVPAGARFAPCEMIYSVFEPEDKNILVKLFEAMELLEGDYLGGMGSRGYGQVVFGDVKMFWNTPENYETGNLECTPDRRMNGDFSTPSAVVQNFSEIKKKLV